MSSIKKRKAAKSLTTLFDKAAIQRHNDQPETIDENLHRYFQSISSTFKAAAFSTESCSPKRRQPMKQRSLPATLATDRYTFSKVDTPANIRLSQGAFLTERNNKEPNALQSDRLQSHNLKSRSSKPNHVSGPAEKENKVSDAKAKTVSSKKVSKSPKQRTSKEVVSDLTFQPTENLKETSQLPANDDRSSTEAKSIHQAKNDATSADQNTTIYHIDAAHTTLDSQPNSNVVVSSGDKVTRLKDGNLSQRHQFEMVDLSKKTKKHFRKRGIVSPQAKKLPDKKRMKQGKMTKERVLSKSVSGKIQTGNNAEKKNNHAESNKVQSNSRFHENWSDNSEEDSTADMLEDIADGAELALDPGLWKVVRSQVNLLREPIMFGGILKHKFQSLVNAETENPRLNSSSKLVGEKVVDGVIKRYNKQLLNYHHQYSETSTAMQKKAVTILKNLQVNDPVNTKQHWQQAGRDLNFDFPTEIPADYNATRSQFLEYNELAAKIDRLREQRKRKHAVLKNMLQIVTDLDQVKKADDRFMQQPCLNPLVARHHAAKLCSALNDARAIASILLKNTNAD